MGESVDDLAAVAAQAKSRYDAALERLHALAASDVALWRAALVANLTAKANDSSSPAVRDAIYAQLRALPPSPEFHGPVGSTFIRYYVLTYVKAACLDVASAVMNARRGEKDMNSRSVARDAVSIELEVAATVNGQPSSLAFSKTFEDAAVFCDECHDEWSAADAALQAARGQLTLKHELQAKHRR